MQNPALQHARHRPSFPASRTPVTSAFRRDVPAKQPLDMARSPSTIDFEGPAVAVTGAKWEAPDEVTARRGAPQLTRQGELQTEYRRPSM